jgi:hypothetical protein
MAKPTEAEVREMASEAVRKEAAREPELAEQLRRLIEDQR